jgi:GTP cyclohydrolase FolE2
VSDAININRSTIITLKDESEIDLNLTIYLSTDSSGSIANERLNSTQLSKTIALVEYTIITACQCSKEDMEETLKQRGN